MRTQQDDVNVAESPTSSIDFIDFGPFDAISLVNKLYKLHLIAAKVGDIIDIVLSLYSSPCTALQITLLAVIPSQKVRLITHTTIASRGLSC